MTSKCLFLWREQAVLPEGMQLTKLQCLIFILRYLVGRRLVNYERPPPTPPVSSI